jgi:PKD repeat protein
MHDKRKFLVLSLVCVMFFSVAPFLATAAADVGSGNSTNNNSTNNNSTNNNCTTGESTVTLPTADFTANVTDGKVPLKVLFTSNCTGNPTEFKWTFGDGIYSNQSLTAIHTYTRPGKYNVSLTVANADGNATATKSGYINVTACKAVCNKTQVNNTKVLCSGKAPLKVMFLDRSKKHISTYWNLGDGTTSKSRNILHIYKKPGKYPVKVTVESRGHYKKTVNAGNIVVK